ncbi:hypothetical protein M0R45_002356 [Rubus argutus]|uniref:Uncharacterized protein n=1 Tax=Rubus argutus TaxID=59490 RepID=A0AAW1VD47_RUBAR
MLNFLRRRHQQSIPCHRRSRHHQSVTAVDAVANPYASPSSFSAQTRHARRPLPRPVSSPSTASICPCRSPIRRQGRPPNPSSAPLAPSLLSDCPKPSHAANAVEYLELRLAITDQSTYSLRRLLPPAHTCSVTSNWRSSLPAPLSHQMASPFLSAIIHQSTLSARASPFAA